MTGSGFAWDSLRRRFARRRPRVCGPDRVLPKVQLPSYTWPGRAGQAESAGRPETRPPLLSDERAGAPDCQFVRVAWGRGEPARETRPIPPRGSTPSPTDPTAAISTHPVPY